MDLRHLRYFIAVAEEQNIGRAAARLHISQPPLTRQIQQLEDELGVRLFTRTPRGMELTGAGELFLEEARNIRALVDQATERTQRAGQGKLGRLDVAIFGSGILDTIPKVLLAFRNAYPEVKLVLHSMSKGEQIEALRQRRIDAGFNRMLAPLPDLATQLVATESLFLAVHESSPLAREAVVPLKALAEHPLIVFPTGARPNFVDKVMGLCQQMGFVPEVAQEVGTDLPRSGIPADQRRARKRQRRSELHLPRRRPVADPRCLFADDQDIRQVIRAPMQCRQ